jgi:hypothetical protein
MDYGELQEIMHALQIHEDAIKVNDALSAQPQQKIMSSTIKSPSKLKQLWASWFNKNVKLLF